MKGGTLGGRGTARRRWGACVLAGAMAPLLESGPGAAQGRSGASRLGAGAVGAVEIVVDASAPGRAISPLIYGVAHAGADDLAATGARLHRWGGNPNTRYNWEHGSAWNAARDWEFRNYGDDAGVTDHRPSQIADGHIALSVARGVETFLTIPAIGWVAKNGSNEARSRGVPRHGGRPLSGADGAITGYDPAANRQQTSVRSRARKGTPFVDQPELGDGVVYQDEWIHYLVRRFGSAATGGVRYYAIDNEPDLWDETHTDVRPARMGYDDLLAVFLEYATAIKDVDPTAQVAGPSLSGWLSLFNSPRDRSEERSLLTRTVRRLLPGAYKYLVDPDRRAHGGEPFLAWWLTQVRRHDERAGRRTLDVLDVHYYPQGLGVYGGVTDAATNARRLRSTRALWDGTYADESWIGEPVRLIPRLREWIDRCYPGTRLAIGEWNWGADGTVNGALGIADVLGIFGREGVDLAAYWTHPPRGSPGALAYALYTDYDGQGSGFGDMALMARSSAPDDVAVYASRDSASGAILIVALNKRSDTDVEIRLRLTGTAVACRVRAYGFGTGQPDAILARDEAPCVADGAGVRAVLTLPVQSATLLRITGD